MGNKEEKRKIEEYKERLNKLKNDLIVLYQDIQRCVEGGLSIREQIAIRDVRLTTCRHIELALDSAIDLCRLALVDKVDLLEHKIKNMLLPTVHFPMDNLLSHLITVFNLHSEEDNNKNKFIGFDKKYKKLNKHLFPDCDLKDDQILKYNKLRNSLHGNYADLDGNYQLINLSDLLDLLEAVLDWLYKIYYHAEIKKEKHIYDEASKAYYAELCNQKDIKKKPNLKNFDQQKLKDFGINKIIGIATYPSIEKIKPGEVYVALVVIHPDRIYKWMHYLDDPSKLNSEQLNLLFAILKEHENICLKHVYTTIKIDDVEESVLKSVLIRAMRDCVNNFLSPEYFVHIADAKHKKDEKRLAYLELNAPINKLEACLLMVDGQHKLIQKPWCLSFKKGASQSLSIAAAAILAQGQKDHDDYIKSKCENHHANV